MSDERTMALAEFVRGINKEGWWLDSFEEHANGQLTFTMHPYVNEPKITAQECVKKYWRDPQ